MFSFFNITVLICNEIAKTTFNVFYIKNNDYIIKVNIFNPMKLKAILVGCGDRACVYAHLGVHELNGLEVVAAVDPNEERLKYVRNNFNVPMERCYKDIKEVLSLGKIADVVINGTMDSLHIETSIPFLKQGYDMLLEKPITNNEKELLELAKVAKENKCKLMVCHVLRFSPFYREIKKILLSGELGRIININTSERVGAYHSSVSFVRGKWNSEATCGSSLLLAKCCHDIDLITWFNNATRPSLIYSDGSRNYFNEEDAPKGCGNRCMVDCPKEIKDKCIYDAEYMYIKNDLLPWYPWQCTKKNYQDLTTEEKIESLKTNNPHGRCVYKCHGDLLNNQQVVIKFEDGSLASHTLVLGAMKAERKIHIMGTLGEIEGAASTGKLYVRTFDKETSGYIEREINFNDRKGETGGHFGGDKGLMEDFITYVSGGKPSVSTTVIEDSLVGHLVVYDADESIRTGLPVKFKHNI